MHSDRQVTPWASRWLVAGDADLDGVAVFAEDADAVPGHARERVREPFGGRPAKAQLPDPGAVVLGTEGPDAPQTPERELEVVPVVGGRERRHHEIHLAG